MLGWRGVREGAAGDSFRQNRLRGLSEPCDHPRTGISRHCDVACLVPKTISFGSKGSGSERSRDRDQEIKVREVRLERCTLAGDQGRSGFMVSALRSQKCRKEVVFCPCINDPFGTLSHVLHVTGARR